MDTPGPISDDHFYPKAHSTTGGSSISADPQGLRIGMISNPLSGGNRKGLQPVEKILAGHSSTLHRQVIQPRDVQTAICDFSRQGVNLMVVNGGDGTIHAVLTALFTTDWSDRLPVLAVLRAGTTSMIARDVGISGSRLQALSRLLNWAHTGQGIASIVKRPVLRLEWETGEKPMYGMFFGAGVIYEGIKFCHDRIYKKGVRGELAAGLTLARFFLAELKGDRRMAPTTPMHVGLEGKVMQAMDVQILFVTTLERLFLGIRPYWGTEAGPMHFTAIRPNTPHLLRVALSVLRGQRSKWASTRYGYLSHNLHDLRLSIQSGFTLDGQLYESDPQRGALSLRSGGEVEFLKL
jgi:diacylglycerol kinase (ATP)